MKDHVDEIIAKHKEMIKEVERLEGSLVSVVRFYTIVMWLCVLCLIASGAFFMGVAIL